MKVCQLGLLVAALAAASPVFAGDGRPSDATLAAMGLSNLHVISDSEGLAVRGLGWQGAKAYGQSFAVVSTPYGSAGSTNGYNASGNKKASGDNFSIAGVEIKQSRGGHGGGGYGNNCNPCGGGKPQSIKIVAFAGGSSTGHR